MAPSKQKLNPPTTKSKQNEYMVEWRKENKERLKEINHRYYIRNKGYLNKTRSRPWNKENIIMWILNGNEEYINMMLRVTRPHKDKLIGLDKPIKDDA
jgi:hypothetical protein